MLSAILTGCYGFIDKMKSITSTTALTPAESDKKNKAFFDALDKGDWKLAKLLVKEGADVNLPFLKFESTNVNLPFLQCEGMTPLHLAVFSGNLDFILFLINSGANLNAKFTNGVSPLHIAVICNSLPIVKLLIEHGANVDALTEPEQHTSLLLSAYDNKTDIGKFLIEKGANVHLKDSFGGNPLHVFVKDGNDGLIDMLLTKGLDIEAQSSTGTPLRLAVKNRQFEAAKHLVKKGALIKPHLFDLMNRDPVFYPVCDRKLSKIFKEKMPQQYADIKELVTRKFLAHVFNIEGTTSFKDHEYVERKMSLRGFESSHDVLIWEKIYNNLKGFSLDYCGLIDARLPELLESKSQERIADPHKLAKIWKEGKPVILEMGFSEHAIYLLCWKDILVICNRAKRAGGGCEKAKAFEVFSSHIDKPIEAIFFEKIAKIKNLNQKSHFEKFLEILKEWKWQRPLFALQLETLTLPLQTVGNCAWSSAEGILLPLFVLNEVYKKNNLPDQEELSKIMAQQKEIFLTWASYMQVSTFKSYLARVKRRNPNNQRTDKHLLKYILQRAPAQAKDKKIMKMWQECRSLVTELG